MNRTGYSTGALAKGDIANGVAMVRVLNLKSIELSALRQTEVRHLVQYVEESDLSDFNHVSIHAPTDFNRDNEEGVVGVLEQIARPRNWAVVMHPDAVWDFAIWRRLGGLLCFENMDKRKGKARTADELAGILELAPDAGVCFDIAHARQVDSSMTEAYRLLRRFDSRIRQIHFSEVNSESRHCRVSSAGLLSYKQIASDLPKDVPVIIESPASLTDAAREVEVVEHFLEMADGIRARAS